MSMEDLEEQLSFNNTLCSESNIGPKRDSLGVVVPIIVIYVIIFVTGSIGNISTCIVIARNRSMHTATNYYLFSLAVSDLLLLVSGLPQEVWLIWERYPYAFSYSFCLVRGLLSETSTNATVLTITAFTIERYLAICHPFLSHTMSKLSRAVKLIVGIWVASICLSIPQAMHLNIAGPVDCSSCTLDAVAAKRFIEISSFVFFVTPMTLISILYALIAFRLNSSSMDKRSANVRVQSKSSRRVVRMLVAVVVAFFICWAPYHAQRLYTIYSHEHFKSVDRTFYFKIYEIVTYVSGVLYYGSATVNPLLYNIMSIKFREAFKDTFSRWCCCVGETGGRSTSTRSYSILSRTAQHGHDSTDSGRDDPSVHSQSTFTRKSSLDSQHSARQPSYQHHKNQQRRYRMSLSARGIELKEHEQNLPQTVPRFKVKARTAARIANGRLHRRNRRRMFRILNYFRKQRSVDEGCISEQNPAVLLELRAAVNPAKQNEKHPSPRPDSSCDISDSSLKDVESGAIEDELTTYMKEIHQREKYLASELAGKEPIKPC